MARNDNTHTDHTRNARTDSSRGDSGRGDSGRGDKDRDDGRPRPRKPIAEPTVWLDFTTGAGVNDRGEPIRPIIGGRRKTPKLVDLLETALHHNAAKLMLCGDVPTAATEWLLPGATARGEFTPGWRGRGHYFGDTPQGRFQHIESGHELNVLLTRMWFPTGDLDPKAALFCHNQLTRIVATAIDRDWPLMRLPGHTFLNIWKKQAPPSYDMDLLDPDVGQEIQANDPQHRVEMYTTGGRCDCGDCLPLITAKTTDYFAYADGRFMFHGVIPDDLGAGPARRIRGDEATELFTRGRGYWPARYLIRYTVPEHWAKQPGWATNPNDPITHLGFFPVRKDTGGWHWPNRPGSTHTAWVDTAELRLARDWWPADAFEILEGVKFAKVDSMRSISNAFTRMLDLVDTLTFGDQPASPQMKKVLSGAVRSMFRLGIGSFARRHRSTHHVAHDLDDVPANAQSVEKSAGGDYVYETPTPELPSDRDTWHPEIAARIWGLARAQVLQTTLGGGSKLKAGALEIPPHELIGIQGDAIYTTVPLMWTFPVDLGGGDDDRSGRIRIKGALDADDAPTTVITDTDGHPQIRLPATRLDLQGLSNAAEAVGWDKWKP